jgi:hypothetical protein
MSWQTCAASALASVQTQEIPMKSFRTLATLAIATLGSLSLMPRAAFAQSGQGSFTLPHEVRWQNVVVPAGNYRFSLEPRGPSALLTLRGDGGHESFLILVSGVTSSKFSNDNRLVMISRAGKSFVRVLDLPEFETTLHFTVPSEGAEKELALASDTPVPTHLR